MDSNLFVLFCLIERLDERKICLMCLLVGQARYLEICACSVIMYVLEKELYKR